MTPEAQQIAIAKAFGWSRAWDSIGLQWIQTSPCGHSTCDPDPNSDWEVYRLPDFLGDLNVMHEAEKALSYEQLKRYHNILRSVCGCGVRYISATAVQRAEAFLRTIGKWEE